jgi:hypothetical protein
MVNDVQLEPNELSAYENVVYVKECLAEFGESPELRQLLGDDVIAFIKNYDASNEGLGEVIGKFFKWIADMFKRIFGISDASDKKAQQQLEQLKKSQIENVELSKYIDVPKATALRKKLKEFATNCVNSLDTYRPRVADDESDVVVDLKHELDTALNDIIGKRRTVKREEAIRFLEETTKLREGLKADAEWLSDKSYNFQKRLKDKGVDLNKYKAVLNTLKFVVQSYARVIQEFSAYATFSDDQTSDGHSGVEGNGNIFTATLEH